ncbi:MAG: heme A synthase [Myxococcales bacterium]|nr:heme A synthase [Myxococcales bacterium]
MKLQTARRLAITTACATFGLLLIGGLVHNTRSSLACPDWPLCFGSAFPKMVGGVFYEHSHRLAATTVGLLTVALAVLLGLRGRRMLWLGLGAVGLVVFQGVLGGLTVIYRLPTMVSTSHLAVSLIFFCLLLYIAFQLREPDAAPLAVSPSLRRLIAIAAGAVFLQSLVGALMRHLGAGLACIDFPMCRGALWPTGVHPSVQLHAAHRLFAVVAGALVCGVAVKAWRAAEGRRALRALAVALPVVVLFQIALGVASILTFLAVVPVTAHLGGAALLLGDLVVLFLATRSAATVTVTAPQRALPDSLPEREFHA